MVVDILYVYLHPTYVVRDTIFLNRAKQVPLFQVDWAGRVYRRQQQDLGRELPRKVRHRPPSQAGMLGSRGYRYHGYRLPLPWSPVHLTLYSY